MIFYFSATGNSKYVAQRLAGATGERLVFLRDAVRSRAYHYDLGRQERLGFVVPTYFFGLPSILTFFLKKLALNGYEDQYIYLVLTCGSTTAGAGSQMRKLLKEKGLALTYDDALVDYLVRKSYSAAYGARTLRRTIQKDVEDTLASEIIRSYDHPITQIAATAEADKVAIRTL